MERQREFQAPKTLLIEEGNFHTAWLKAVRNVLKKGAPITFGSEKEPKYALDTCQIIELYGPAIKQIKSKSTHPQFPFQRIEEYCEEYTRGYLAEYPKKPEIQKFVYLYFERFAQYNDASLDQVVLLKDQLAEQIRSGIPSNRDQMITWQPGIDLGSKSPPCLQRVWIRYLGNEKVILHYTWRSRDLFSAWQANIIALTDMLYREVLKPNNCEIVKLIDFCDSLHIYKSDMQSAKEAVKMLPAFGNFV
ncbi:MAG: thymidylate synthase [Patescibacteria group bacterium]|nr:thymidylate synthase [Patescibacteria group bacterium]